MKRWRRTRSIVEAEKADRQCHRLSVGAKIHLANGEWLEVREIRIALGDVGETGSVTFILADRYHWDPVELPGRVPFELACGMLISLDSIKSMLHTGAITDIETPTWYGHVLLEEVPLRSEDLDPCVARSAISSRS
jgi:hypothetical protein